MKYNKEIIFEIQGMLKSLSKDQRNSLRRYLANSEAGRVMKILDELESLDTVLKTSSISILNRTDSNKEFLRFKKKMQEYFVTDSCIELANKEDLHVKTQIELLKSLYTSEVIFEKGLPHLAIDSLKMAYQLSTKIEAYSLQLNISEKIENQYRTIGDKSMEIYWNKKKSRTNAFLNNFKKITLHFNLISESNPCCSFHVNSKRFLADQINPDSICLESVKLDWHLHFIQAIKFQNQTNYRSSQLLAFDLLNCLKNHPRIFSKKYELVLFRLFIENMTVLKKKNVLKMASQQISFLLDTPIFQAFPLIQMNFIYLFKENKPDKMLEIININLRDDIELGASLG